MTSYRVYRLSPIGKIKTGDWMEAANDAEARTKALQLCDNDHPSVEVWCGAKRVDVLGSPPLAARAR